MNSVIWVMLLTTSSNGDFAFLACVKMILSTIAFGVRLAGTGIIDFMKKVIPSCNWHQQ